MCSLSIECVLYTPSFFCGDAAGRPEGDKPWKGTSKKDKSKDFSDSDRRFAINAGLPFYTPEHYFLGSDPLALDPSFCPGFDPSSVSRTSASAYQSIHVPEKGQEMVHFFFLPGLRPHTHCQCTCPRRHRTCSSKFWKVSAAVARV
jgi:bifunctional polynucleotide phosphatase/kinase